MSDGLVGTVRWQTEKTGSRGCQVPRESPATA